MEGHGVARQKTGVMFRHGAPLVIGELEHRIFVAVARIHESLELLEIIIVYVRSRAVRITPLRIPLDFYTVKQQPNCTSAYGTYDSAHDKTQEHVGTFL